MEKVNSRYATGVLVLLALALPAHTQTLTEGARLDAMKAKGVNASIMVFPMRVGNPAMPWAGELLALQLEQAGLQKMDWTAEVFAPARAATFGQIRAAFSDYVRKSSIETDYALYTEVSIPPGGGNAEMRGVLVEKSGNPVFSFLRYATAHHPLECIDIIARDITGVLNVKNPFGPEPYKGRLAKRYAERTGVPTEDERSAMQKAAVQARSQLASSKLLVFPTLVNTRPNPSQAVHLAQVLTESKVAAARPISAEPGIQIRRVPNEMERLWQMARDFRAYLRQSPVDADYALLADHMFAPDGKVFTVHFVLSDGKGEWVIVDMQNEHHEDFRSVELKSADDCDGLVLRRLAKALRENEK